jgi:endonuclease III
MASDATILAFLDEHFPHAHCELHYQTLDHLIVAVMLSAQTTDLAVNRVTPALFQAFPTLADLSKVSPNKSPPTFVPLDCIKPSRATWLPWPSK